MKNSLLGLVLLAAPVAFGASTDVTTMDQDTVSSTRHYDTNSNDRFNNRDVRSNSASTPAQAGSEQSQLTPDISSNKYVEPSTTGTSDQSRMTGSSTTSTPSANDQYYSAPMSGSSTQESDTNLKNSYSVPPSGSVSGSSSAPSEYNSNYSSESERLSGTGTEAAGAATGAAGAPAAGQVVEETTTTTETTTTSKAAKKAKKSSKAHKKSGSSSGKSSSSSDKSSSSSSDQSGSSSSDQSSSSPDRSSGSSSSMDTSSSKSAAGPAAGAAAGSNSGKSMSGDTSYNKDKNLSAQDTSRNQQESQLVQKIRSEISANKNLSVNAQNVKIISQNGQIYLKGPVADANEKVKVEEIAKRVAGNTTVINQTTIGARSGTSSGQSGPSGSTSDQSNSPSY